MQIIIKRQNSHRMLVQFLSDTHKCSSEPILVVKPATIQVNPVINAKWRFLTSIDKLI